MTPDQPGQAGSNNAGNLITASSQVDLDQLSAQLTVVYSASDQGAIFQILAQIENLAGAASGGATPTGESEAAAATGFRGSKGFELKNAPYQSLRNAPGEVNGRLYTGHAFDQMQNRGIMPSVVDNTIQNGTIFATRAGTTGYYDAVNNVRVIVNSTTGRVVTIIRGAP